MHTETATTLLTKEIEDAIKARDVVYHVIDLREVTVRWSFIVIILDTKI